MPVALVRRAQLIALSLLFAAAVGSAAAFAAVTRSRDALLYNHSASMPVGFYLRRAHSGPPSRGDIVTVRARDVASAYASARGFNDAGDRFLKRVVAVSGDVVCADREVISVNGVIVAERLMHDGQARALPRWSGCARLDDHVLLLGDAPDSFDGRYWGPTDTVNIEGVWRPLGF